MLRWGFLARGVRPQRPIARQDLRQVIQHWVCGWRRTWCAIQTRNTGLVFHANEFQGEVHTRTTPISSEQTSIRSAHFPTLTCVLHRASKMFPFDTQRLNIHVGGTFFNDTMALKFIPSARSTRWWSTHLQITSLEGEKEWGQDHVAGWIVGKLQINTWISNIKQQVRHFAQNPPAHPPSLPSAAPTEV